MINSSDTLQIEGKNLRSSLLDTAAMAVLFGCALLVFGSALLAFAFELAKLLPQSHLRPPTTVVAFVTVDLALCTYLTAYFLSSFIFSVRLNQTDLSYRNGFGRYTIASSAIEEICFLTSLKSWRYIIIRAAASTTRCRTSFGLGTILRGCKP